MKRREALAKFAFVAAQISFGSLIAIPFMTENFKLYKLLVAGIAVAIGIVAGYFLTPKN